MIELRRENRIFIRLSTLAEVTVIVGRYGLEMEAVYKEITPLLQPLVAIVLCRALEGPEPRPAAALRKVRVHLRHVIVDTIHHGLKSLVLETPKVEVGEIEHLTDAIPIGRQPDVGRLRVLPKGFIPTLTHDRCVVLGHRQELRVFLQHPGAHNVHMRPQHGGPRPPKDRQHLLKGRPWEAIFRRRILTVPKNVQARRAAQVERHFIQSLLHGSAAARGPEPSELVVLPRLVLGKQDRLIGNMRDHLGDQLHEGLLLRCQFFFAGFFVRHVPCPPAARRDSLAAIGRIHRFYF